MMGKQVITEAQAQRLYDAAFNMCGSIAADACRVVAEWDGDANLVPYLETMPVKYARELELAVFAISDGAMESESQEAEQQRKYEAAMAELRSQSA